MISGRRGEPHEYGDLLYEGAPDFGKPRSWAWVGIYLGLLFVVVAVLWYIDSLDGESSLVSMLPMIIWFPVSTFIQVRVALKTRYRVWSEGLEWTTPGSGAPETAFAPWERIVWFGRKPPGREALRALEGEYRLTPGRIKSIPSMPGRGSWRIIYSGARLYHAVDFHPTEEYLEILRRSLPADVEGTWRA